MDEQAAYSFWCELPPDVLWLIINLTGFIGFHCVSAVCNSWRSVCKSYCKVSGYPPMPSDPIPWFVTNSNGKSVVEIYRPSINKTYKIDLPELRDTNCLHSKDGWMLLRNYSNDTYFLLNLFTVDKIYLPLLRVTDWFRGTFSTILKCPNVVILIKYDIQTATGELYVWKSGSNIWKTHQLDLDYIGDSTWICDDQFYCYYVF
ncbi:hypothetical protein IFM89_025848 [Coptis chinensis]|uniref:F-box domain-containing protein n=1 Tax=Coptis chinensis TaxID=261450 RepID=A0A835I5R5_9MAGN|nr:hypothetical protein IFM89_025848 [Coptis chinensis]